MGPGAEDRDTGTRQNNEDVRGGPGSSDQSGSPRRSPPQDVRVTSTAVPRATVRGAGRSGGRAVPPGDRSDGRGERCRPTGDMCDHLGTPPGLWAGPLSHGPLTPPGGAPPGAPSPAHSRPGPSGTGPAKAPGLLAAALGTVPKPRVSLTLSEDSGGCTRPQTARPRPPVTPWRTASWAGGPLLPGAPSGFRSLGRKQRPGPSSREVSVSSFGAGRAAVTRVSGREKPRGSAARAMAGSADGAFRGSGGRLTGDQSDRRGALSRRGGQDSPGEGAGAGLPPEPGAGFEPGSEMT